MLYSFVYYPIMYGDRNVHIILYNLEMTEEQILSKLLGIYVYQKYGIVMSFKQMFSRGRGYRLSDEYYTILHECEPILAKFCEHITFYSTSLTVEKFASTMNQELKKYGKFEGDEYHPDDPNMILEVIVDHLNLVQASGGLSKKQCMDAISDMSVQIRNKTKIVSPVFLMQMNRNAANAERIRAQMLEPGVEDLKESSTINENASCTLLLYNPFANRMNSHRGYDVKQLQNRYISMICAKNRFGTANIADALAYYGEICTFTELPKPDEIYDYSKYQSADWLLEKDDKKEDRPELNSKLVL